MAMASASASAPPASESTTRDVSESIEQTYPCLVEHNLVQRCDRHVVFGDGCAIFGDGNVVYGTSCLVVGHGNVIAGIGGKYVEGTATHFRNPTYMVSAQKLTRGWVRAQFLNQTDFARRFAAFWPRLRPMPVIEEANRVPQPFVAEADRDLMLEQVLRGHMGYCSNLSYLSRGRVVPRRISAMPAQSAAPMAPSVRIEITASSSQPRRSEPTFFHNGENRVRSMLFGEPRAVPPQPVRDSTRTLVWSAQTGLTALSRRLPDDDDEADVPKAFQCTICMTRAKDTLCTPCNHSCLCVPCVRDLVVRDANRVQCPLCRAPVETVLKIY